SFFQRGQKKSITVGKIESRNVIIGARTGGKGPSNAALVEFGKKRVQNCAGTNADITNSVSITTRAKTSIVLRRSFAIDCAVFWPCSVSWFCDGCDVLVRSISIPSLVKVPYHVDDERECIVEAMKAVVILLVSEANPSGTSTSKCAGRSHRYVAV